MFLCFLFFKFPSAPLSSVHVLIFLMCKNTSWKCWKFSSIPGLAEINRIWYTSLGISEIHVLFLSINLNYFLSSSCFATSLLSWSGRSLIIVYSIMKERCNTCFEVLTTLFPHICCLLLSFCKFVFYNHSAMLILCDLFWFCPYCSYCMTSSHLSNSSSGSSVAMEVQSSGVALNSGIYLVSELGFAVFFHSCQGGSVSGSW